MATPKKQNQKNNSTKNKVELPPELKELEEDLVELNPEILKGLNPKKRVEILQTVSVFSMRHHSGPLPDPETLQRYCDLIPNGGDRIMKMAENQSQHRIQIEEKFLTRTSNQSLLGQIFGFIIGLFGIMVGGYLIKEGHAIVGSLFAGGTIVSLVSVFVLGKKGQSNSEDEKKL